MGWFRVAFRVGWCAVDVHAEDGVDAHRKIWDALDQLSHGAVEGLRLGSCTLSTQRIRELGNADNPGPKAGAPTCLSAPPAARGAREGPHRLPAR